ncbi:hypothetical protein [Oryza sativa Japonica Group]|uniref:Uncharacterized protein n=1 Tax=Oryza sativa subsp. japonica TaxID=39947 RepID=Q5JK07_ORYSJ|nr:hypothetical protein [Oryza sativa Japonica Group]
MRKAAAAAAAAQQCGRRRRRCGDERASEQSKIAREMAALRLLAFCELRLITTLPPEASAAPSDWCGGISNRKSNQRASSQWSGRRAIFDLRFFVSLRCS